MTNKEEVKKDNSTINPMVAAVAGVAAAAAVLSNDKVVSQVKDKLAEGADKVEKVVETAKEAIKVE